MTGKQSSEGLIGCIIQPHYKSLNDQIPHFVPSYFDCLMVKAYNSQAAHKHRVALIKRMKYSCGGMILPEADKTSNHSVPMNFLMAVLTTLVLTTMLQV
jgi:hypothetical protein